MTKWTQIQPGGDTICSVGTPYAFFVRRGNSNNLLIYFQPGGAKLPEMEYDPQKPQFDPTVYIPTEEGTARDPHWDNDNPGDWNGIFNLADERNPFRDYSIVFVSYCSADLHLGNGKVDDFHHRGYHNASAALSYAYQHFPNPERLFVAGSSAGGVAASHYIGRIAAHYPLAKTAILIDSIGGVRLNIASVFKTWGTDQVMLNSAGFGAYSADELQLTTPYIVNGKLFPHIPIAQFNATRDFAQSKITERFGDGSSLIENLRANHADIRAEIDNLYTFSADADYHVILRKDKFYTEEANGVRLYEWVTALANGEPVDNVEPNS